MVMSKINKINILPLIVAYAIFIIDAIAGSTISIKYAVLSLLTIICSYILGSAVIPKNFKENLTAVTHGLYSVFIGLFLYALLIFVSTNIFFLMVSQLLVAVTIAIILKVRFSFFIEKYELIATIVAAFVFILIFKNESYIQLTATQGINDYTDPYFYTSIVSTVSHGSFFNASYEAGTPIIYQNLGFIIPGMLKDLLQISSHQSCWGIIQPFYTFIVILSVYDLSYCVFKEKIRRNNYFFILASICFPVLLAPLHPLFIAKLDVHNFIFNGIGYLIPSGTVTYPISMCLSILSLIAFSLCDWNSTAGKYQKIFFAVILGSVSFAKLPMFVAMVLFYVGVILYRWIILKERLLNYLPYGILAIAVAFLLFKGLISGASNSAVTLKFGYLLQYVKDTYLKNISIRNNAFVVILVLVLLYLIWFGERLLGFFGLLRSKGSFRADFFYGAILTLLVTTIMALCLNITYFNIDGSVLNSGNSDLEQFIRSSFYVATLASAIGLLYLIFDNSKMIVRKITIFSAVTWCLFTFITLASPHDHIKECPASKWYKENLPFIASGKLDNGLIAVNPFAQPYGIMMGSSDYGKYWTCMGRATGCYNCSLKNSYRWYMFNRLIKNHRENLIDSMKNDGLKYIVATPKDIVQLDSVAKMYPGKMKKMENSNWIFILE